MLQSEKSRGIPKGQSKERNGEKKSLKKGKAMKTRSMDQNLTLWGGKNVSASTGMNSIRGVSKGKEVIAGALKTAEKRCGGGGPKTLWCGGC